jgi:hypothetical protein
MKILDFISATAWPIAILVIALMYRRPIYDLLHHAGGIAERAAKEPFKVALGKFEVDFKREVEAKNPQSIEDTLSSAADVAKGFLPYGVPYPGKPGLVIPPWPPFKLVAIHGAFPPHSEVRDPYTGKIFLVPPKANEFLES